MSLNWFYNWDRIKIYLYLYNIIELYICKGPTSPVEAISQRSTGSASLSRGQENMGAW